MTIEQVSAVLQETIRISLVVSAPFLVAAVSVGLVISILQAATSVNEQTLTFVPKIVAVLGTFTVLFPWMMGTIIDFGVRLMDSIAMRGGP